jgi:hypothetical protein
MSVTHLKGLAVNGDIAARQNTSTGETDLSSIVIPAGSFDSSGDCIHIKCWGLVANNANAKTLTFYFGASTQAFVLKASVATAWNLDLYLFATGANAQEGIATLNHGVIAAAQVDTFRMAFTEPSSNAITVKTTGTGGATADILQKGFVVLT